MNHYSVIIVGGGQAGLSTSYYLQDKGIDHLVIEKHEPVFSWKHLRWDSFTLVTPNWQCDLPGHSYTGDDPNGFMTRGQIIDYLNAFVTKVGAPLLANTKVEKVSQEGSVYHVATNNGEFTADQVVVASGGYHLPIIPPMSADLPDSIQQLHSEQYKNPSQLGDGAVLVVGSGQSGAQIAEDLHLAGKKVFLACGDAPRCARFYRGKDVVDWLAEMGYYDMPVSEHPLKEGVRDNTNHYVTGRDGGRDIDLRRFAKEGMELYGALLDLESGDLKFKTNLAEVLNDADQTYNSINEKIDHYIEQSGIDAPKGGRYEPLWAPEKERSSLELAKSGITDIVWCIGFKPDFSWLDVPVFDEKGYPRHERGVTDQDGLYFIGLPWLHTWGSGRFSGIKRDAEYLVNEIASEQVKGSVLAANG